MNQEMMNKLPELLNKLGDQLGVAGAKVWGWALLNVKATIIQDIIFLLGFILFVIIEYIIIQFVIKKDLFDDCDVLCIFSAVIGVILTIIGAIVFVIVIMELPSLIINPEWHAFQNIMSQVSKIK